MIKLLKESISIIFNKPYEILSRMEEPKLKEKTKQDRKLEGHQNFLVEERQRIAGIQTEIAIIKRFGCDFRKSPYMSDETTYKTMDFTNKLIQELENKIKIIENNIKLKKEEYKDGIDRNVYI